MQLQLPIVKVLRLRRLLQLLGLLLLKLLMTRKLPPPPLQLATPFLQALLMIPLFPKSPPRSPASPFRSCCVPKYAGSDEAPAAG